MIGGGTSSSGMIGGGTSSSGITGGGTARNGVFRAVLHPCDATRGSLAADRQPVEQHVTQRGTKWMVQPVVQRGYEEVF